MHFELPQHIQEFRERVRHIAQTEIAPHAAETDRTEQYPWQCVEVLKREGFMGMTIPEVYGGRFGAKGASYLQTVVLIEEMAKACSATGRICVDSNMGAVGAILKYGTEEQKRLAAGLILAGDKPAICITEPEAGSAATEMTTRAERKGDRYVLNGRKHWITGGGVSRLHLVFARVIEEGKDQGIGGFIVVRDPKENAPRGFVIGKREPAMGVRGIPESEILLQDLEVPQERMVVPPEGIRKGFAGLMAAYNGQRVGAGTVAHGIAVSAYELALDYAKRRRQFGRPIAEFQGIQWMLADMSIQLAASRALLYGAAARAGDGFPNRLDAAQAKVFAAETAVRVTNDALQIHGAMGYSRDLALERKVRDARMFPIAGGTAQILRTQVAGEILGMRTPQTRDGYLKAAS